MNKYIFIGKEKNIEIVPQGICVGCPFAELELDSCGTTPCEKHWVINCEHSESCERAYTLGKKESE